ncbi:MAG: hypothetical protein A3F74_01225 [Betaproteobacteria bacterium RIFCSPLOWO2_12_FULL_62_58]|nr:MAG: hypothetical protein A3F74_01225 [Betaproteobacteria bacterium RIFCSPLOWO2_12_FULL_62_58]
MGARICLVTSAEGPRLVHRKQLFELLKEKHIVRPDTELGITLQKHTLTHRAFVEGLYFEMLQSTWTVEGILQAEKDGYDAAVIACYFDPGLEAAREVARIPVVGLAEASMAYASLLAKKKRSIAIIAVAEKGVLKTYDVIDKYGLTEQLIPNRPVRHIPFDMLVAAANNGKVSDVEAAKQAHAAVARECIKDGAEIVITGCAGLGPMLAVEGVFDVDGVPVMDPVSVAVKTAESLVDLQKLGLKLSRKLMYRLPVSEDISNKERAHFGFGSAVHDQPSAEAVSIAR